MKDKIIQDIINECDRLVDVIFGDKHPNLYTSEYHQALGIGKVKAFYYHTD